jgi:ankyrin repeat protein
MLSILFLAVLLPLSGYTADSDSDLINAVLQDDTATVNALLGTGSDVNAKDRNGETVLILAAKYGHTDVVEALLAKGA